MLRVRASATDGPSTINYQLSTYRPHTLRSEIKQSGAISIDRCLEIARALASALADLHARSLVHHDVKPSNVIFVGGAPKLADIGIVAGMDEARSFVGTEGYIPPEGPGTPSADCYSLGKLLYELSTGHDRTAWPEPPVDFATRPDREQRGLSPPDTARAARHQRSGTAGKTPRGQTHQSGTETVGIVRHLKVS